MGYASYGTPSVEIIRWLSDNDWFKWMDDKSENDNNSEKELKLENLSVPTPEKEVISIYEYKDSSRYTIFSLKVPKFPEKDDLIVKIDSIIPITILILTLYINRDDRI